MKIVAIGGGNNSDIHKNGEPDIYEQENIDREIIRITGKSNPKVLFIPHASDDEYGSFRKICNTYGVMYQCPVKMMSKYWLNDSKMVDVFLNWADIIYVGGGNTREMLKIWHETGFDQKLIDTAKKNKVLCGISAGAGCWFNYTCSDYLQMETGDITSPLMPVEGLGLVDLVFNPHANYSGRMKAIQKITENLNKNGLSLTNNMAIEIMDDEYKLIRGISSERLDIEAILSRWEDKKYVLEPVKEEGLLKELTGDLTKTYKKKNKH